MRMTRRDRLNLVVASLLAREVDVAHPFIGAEIGVWKGELSHHLLTRFSQLILMMVDPYVTYQGSRVGSSAEGLKAAQHEAEDRTMDFPDRRTIIVKTSVDASAYVSPESLDFVFIDGDHRYESVLADLMHWVPKVKRGGLVFGHDFKDRDGFGVKQAVFEFTKRHYPVGINVVDARIEGVFWFIKERGRIL